MKQKAIFLDRDGVLNKELNDYICQLADFHPLLYQIEALKKLHDEGYLLIIITNQGGIAQGRYSVSTLDQMHEILFEAFKQAGAPITKAYYCPHHPTVSEPCTCRKPQPGMILEAIAIYNIDPKQSIMIGDKLRDIEAAAAAGVRGMLIAPDEIIRYEKVKSLLNAK